MVIGLVGSPEPRLHTPALSPSTRGGEFIAFCARLGVPLLPWQQTLARRALETHPDGTYRFRTVVVPVGRQSGKTTFCKMLALWRMVEDGAKLVVGAAQSLDISREAWAGAVDVARDAIPDAVDKVRLANGEQCLTLVNGARYRIVATTAGAGRGLSVDLLIMDEARMMRDWAPWSALSKTTIARPNSQIWVISNAGDDQSVVLNTLREKALQGGDDTLGLFEWSGDPDLELSDPRGWAQGCPGLGYTVPLTALQAAYATDPPAVFTTEILCRHVTSLTAAVDARAWEQCQDKRATLDGLRDRVAVVLDVAADNSHVTLVAAAVDDDGLVRVEPVAAWPTVQEARLGLPAAVDRVKPRVKAWFSGGPAQVLARDLDGWDEIKGTDVTEACMGFAALVTALVIRHGGDPLLSTHVLHAERMRVGDAWRFVRPHTGGNVDAAYAAAGAVHLARAITPRRRRIIVA